MPKYLLLSFFTCSVTLVFLEGCNSADKQDDAAKGKSPTTDTYGVITNLSDEQLISQPLISA